MKQIIFILPLLFLLPEAPAQKQFKYFFGTVADAQTLKPIKDVNITIEGRNIGEATDKKGEFSFFIDTVPVYMVVSHLAYETKRIWLDNTSAKINIRLNPAAKMLEEVEIIATTGPESFYNDDAYSVLDYEVEPGRVYLLIFRFRLAQSQIISMKPDGSREAASQPLNFRPDSLFRDCIGFVHLIGRDSAYQLYTDSTKILLNYPAPFTKFEQVLKNCVASTPSKLFFKQNTQNGFGIDFFSVDRKTSAKERVASVTDEKSLSMLRRNKDDYARILSSDIPSGRSEFQEWNWARKIMYKPRTASMHRIGGYICVFNTAEETIEIYTPDGDFTSKVLMTLGKIDDGRWTKSLYVDEISEKAFTAFIKNGKISLYRINMNTGSLTFSKSIFHFYPEKIRIIGGNAYYMYRVPGTQENKQLYRQWVN